MKPLFLIILFSLAFTSCGTHKSKSNSCLEKQAVVEYGTSRVKMLIAEKNICEKQDLKTLGKTEWEVEINKNIIQLPNGMVALQPNILSDLKNISTNISRLMKNFKVQKIFGIATGVYRTLDKREAVFSDLENIIDGKIIVLTPEEEAQMGLQSIVASEKPTGNFIVWDFGGNNMQFSIINNGKTSAVIGLPGSNGIRTEVMNKLKKKKTPNPIGLKNVSILEKHLLAKLTSNLDTLKQYKDFEVYGIGGVHAKSIYSGMLHILNDAEAKKMYSQEQVKRLLNELVKMNDSLIGGKFPEDQASNVIAVNTIMNHVGWKSVKVSEQTLALGYLISK